MRAKDIQNCRACGHPDMHPILDLGAVPLANSLLTAEDLQRDKEERFPLSLFFCPQCALVQIGETVVPDKMFSHYLYASSFSDTMLSHAKNLVHRLVGERNLGPGNRIVEIASNDGYLLQYYAEQEIEVLGIEPAANIAELATNKGIPTLVEFFNKALGEKLASEGVLADVVHAHNVFAHVPNPGDFVAGLKQILSPGGVIVIEVPYLGTFIDNLEFDTIYHEHFSYFSLTSVRNIVHQVGLAVSDVEYVPIHGGSIRISITHADECDVSPNVDAMLAEEKKKGVDQKSYYENFAGRVYALKVELVEFLESLKAQGKSVAAYGASAKGSTLMNTFGIGAEMLDFVADRSTLKQGRLTPGNHLPIVPPEMLVERMPDYALLLTWNFADEILEQQKAYRDAGGKFIIPLPELRVL